MIVNLDDMDTDDHGIFRFVDSIPLPRGTESVDEFIEDKLPEVKNKCGYNNVVGTNHNAGSYNGHDYHWEYDDFNEEFNVLCYIGCGFKAFPSKIEMIDYIDKLK